MTAETLKPFITPTSDVNNFPAKHSGVTHSKRKIKHLIPTILSIIAAALVIGILSLTIWQTLHVQKLESDLNGLKRDMESLRERLGINYLEDLAEFQKDYQNMLIPDHSQEIESEVDNDDDDEYEDVDDDDDVDMTVVDDDNDDYADENYHQENDETNWEDYVDMVKKEKIDNQSNETESSASTSSSASNDDNVFEDFTTYSDSKKKKQRKSRSIADLRTELQSNDVAQNHMQAKTEQHSLESGATTESQVSHHHSRKSHSRSRSRQSRRRLLVRKGESPVSAKSADFNVDNVRSAGNSGTPAAHFHLYGTVSHTHHGDMYVGHATASMNNQWQQHFSVDNGILTVRRSGLYYVYAQICYNDNHDQNGFIIFHGDNPFLQCLNTVPTNMTNKLHTCHTSGLIHLHENESIHLRDIHQDRKVVLRNSSNRSYFGIIKI